MSEHAPERTIETTRTKAARWPTIARGAFSPGAARKARALAACRTCQRRKGEKP
jgi:hypothetical protein